MDEKDEFLRTPPYLYGQMALATPDLPGIGGVIKSLPEDFIVEEIAAYEPLGEGEHLFVKVQKRAMTTRDLVLYVSHSLNIPEVEIGVAGMKDKQGVTTQYISVPRAHEAKLGLFHHADLRILAVKPHPHKLRTGHLWGNRFVVTIRKTVPAREILLAPLLAALGSRGILNFYDVQRLGDGGKTARDGLKLLAGQSSGRFRGKWHMRLLLSAAQAWIFNCYLYERHQRYGAGLLMGDLVMKRESGGVFWIDDLASGTQRLAEGEIIPTGPIFGTKMREAHDESGLFEVGILAETGLTPASFQPFGKNLEGSRRALMAFPIDLKGETLVEDEEAVRVSFCLPAGSYATVLLAEITKTRGPPASVP